MKTKTSIVCLAALMTTGIALAGDLYTVDADHASIGFEVSHLVISKVRGSFTDYTATLELGAEGQLLGATATIQTQSIDTANEKRDDHLRNADFFDVETHPEITFKSTAAEKREGKDVLVGDLTIRGVTREVVMAYSVLGPIKDPWGNTKIGFAATTTINRADFGLIWNRALETGGVVVGEDVDLQINLEAARQ